MIDAHLTSFKTLNQRKYQLASLVICAIIGVLEWHHLRALVTERATPTSAVAAPMPRIRAEGTLVAYPGAEVVLSAETAGRLVVVNGFERMPVKQGDVLARINVEEQEAALLEARRTEQAADVDLVFFGRELVRTRTLAASAAAPASALERGVHDRNVALVRRDLARATVQRLAAVVRKGAIVSPIDGVIIRRMLSPGEMVVVGAAIFVVADLTRTRIVAEVDEYDVGRIELGLEAVVRAEGHRGSWRGIVEEIPVLVTSRLLVPSDPARPSDTRVLLVKVRPEESLPIKLGQRV